MSTRAAGTDRGQHAAAGRLAKQLRRWSAAVIWSRTYDVTLRDGFSPESELATTILEAVRAALDAKATDGAWRLKVEVAGGD